MGLTALQFFDHNGSPITFADAAASIRAEPADVNVLGAFLRDPRTADKLLDGVCCTCDDLHMWLAPFEQGRVHRVMVRFPHALRLAMVRVWNYNKSRIHSYRGARLVRMSLDGALIFEGEIGKASGEATDAQCNADTLLFTTDAAILRVRACVRAPVPGLPACVCACASPRPPLTPPSRSPRPGSAWSRATPTPRKWTPPMTPPAWLRRCWLDARRSGPQQPALAAPTAPTGTVRGAHSPHPTCSVALWLCARQPWRTKRQ